MEPWQPKGVERIPDPGGDEAWEEVMLARHCLNLDRERELVHRRRRDFIIGQLNIMEKGLDVDLDTFAFGWRHSPVSQMSEEDVTDLGYRLAVKLRLPLFGNASGQQVEQTQPQMEPSSPQ